MSKAYTISIQRQGPRDDPTVRWDDFDTVALRSTWDYPRKHRAFLKWVDVVEPRVQNPARVVRWNSDKHHLADLADAAIPVVPTSFVEPGSRIPPLEGEVVVKPTISAAGRDTGRFGPSTHDQATELISRLQGEGRAAMVQPYVSSVDASGEVALVFIGGGLSSCGAQARGPASRRGGACRRKAQAGSPTRSSEGERARAGQRFAVTPDAPATSRRFGEWGYSTTFPLMSAVASISIISSGSASAVTPTIVSAGHGLLKWRARNSMIFGKWLMSVR